MSVLASCCITSSQKRRVFQGSDRVRTVLQLSCWAKMNKCTIQISENVAFKKIISSSVQRDERVNKPQMCEVVCNCFLEKQWIWEFCGEEVESNVDFPSFWPSVLPTMEGFLRYGVIASHPCECTHIAKWLCCTRWQLMGLLFCCTCGRRRAKGHYAQ